MKKVSRCLILGVCVLTLGREIAQGQTSEPLDYILWTEVNVLEGIDGSARYYNNAVAGINQWSEVTTNGICVATNVKTEINTNGNYKDLDLEGTIDKVEALYGVEKLQHPVNGCPDANIIPGIKTKYFFATNFPKKIDSLYPDYTKETDHCYLMDQNIQQWQNLVTVLRTIYRTTDCDQLFLDNELPYGHLCFDCYTPEWQPIEDGLALLGQWANSNGVEILWYPGTQDDLKYEEDRYYYRTSQRLMGLVTSNGIIPDENISIVPTSLYYDYPNLDNPQDPYGSKPQVLFNLSYDSCHFENIFSNRFRDDKDWDVGDIPRMQDEIPGTDFFVIYPHWVNFVITGIEAARVFNDKYLLSAESLIVHGDLGELGVQVFPPSPSNCDPRLGGNASVQVKLLLTFSGPITESITVDVVDTNGAPVDSETATLLSSDNGIHAEVLLDNFSNGGSYAISVSGGATGCFTMNILYGNVIDAGSSLHKVDTLDLAVMKTYLGELVNMENFRYDILPGTSGDSFISSNDRLEVSNALGTFIDVITDCN